MQDRPTQDGLDMLEVACSQLLREWISAREPAWLPLNGRSMAPFLPSGSRVLVSKTAAGQIGCGDLLVYELEGRLICHRVLRRKTQGDRYLYLTKGDGRQTIASWVAEEQVLGKVPRVEREGQLVDLNTLPRRLQAVSTATSSLMIIGVRALLKWGKQSVMGGRTWARHL